MVEGRIWQRGASKGRKNSSNARQMQQNNQQLPESFQADPMMSAIQKSLIAETIHGARASLHEPSRPYTPGDLPRHLFQGDDYQNRPGSSYKMNNVVGQAVDEFQQSAAKQLYGGSTTAGSSAASHTTLNSTASKVGKPPRIGGVGGASIGSHDDVLNIMQRASESMKKNQPFRPHMQGLSGLSVLPKQKKIGAFQPVGQGLNTNAQAPAQAQVQAAGFEAGKPIKVSLSTKKQIVQDRISPKKVGKPQADSPTQMESLSALVKDMTEESKKEEASRFDQSKNDTLKKMQDITAMLAASGDIAEEAGELEQDDEFGDYMEQSLLQDADSLGIFEKAAEEAKKEEYSNALKRVEEEVAKVKEGADQSQQKTNDDEMEQYGDDMMNSMMAKEESLYMAEYNDVISTISHLCNKLLSKKSHKNDETNQYELAMNEELTLRICPRVWALASEFKLQKPEDQNQCFLETVLKGSFSLLAIKSPRVALKVSNCNVHLFFKLFKLITKPPTALEHTVDFKKVFNYLFETVRGLLIYAKEGRFDLLFMEEGLITQLLKVISTCFIEQQRVVCLYLNTEVAGKVVKNDDKLLDLLNYTIGTIKCFTQSSKEVQETSVDQQMVQLLSQTITHVIRFQGCPISKKAMILVQITGTLRNLANVESSHFQLSKGAIAQLCDIFFDSRFNTGKELSLNIARLLSKVSLDMHCAEQIVKSGHLGDFLKAMVTHKESSAILIRIAYILGNLTTNFEEARSFLCDEPETFKIIFELASFYLEKDRVNHEEPHKAGSAAGGKVNKYEEFNTGNLEDALTKVIKLLANLSTEETVALVEFHKADTKQLLITFLKQLFSAVDRRTVENNEEFILNAISCTTNILYYDTAQKPILESDLRAIIFHSSKQFLLATQNEEIQIETVRVMSNLSRHSQLCDQQFTQDKQFCETLVIVLDHTLRDLVFYSVGILINMSLHAGVRPTLLQMDVLMKLIDVLRDANLEDMELAKVAAKAIHNLQGIEQINQFWTEQAIAKLDEVTLQLGEELDSIMDVATEDEMVQISGLRDLLNALVNDMPELTKDCPIDKCGRKFKSQAELEKHLDRRHGIKSDSAE